MVWWIVVCGALVGLVSLCLMAAVIYLKRRRYFTAWTVNGLAVASMVTAVLYGGTVVAALVVEVTRLAISLGG